MYILAKEPCISTIKRRELVLLILFFFLFFLVKNLQAKLVYKPSFVGTQGSFARMDNVLFFFLLFSFFLENRQAKLVYKQSFVGIQGSSARIYNVERRQLLLLAVLFSFLFFPCLFSVGKSASKTRVYKQSFVGIEGRPYIKIQGGEES